MATTARRPRVRTAAHRPSAARRDGQTPCGCVPRRLCRRLTDDPANVEEIAKFVAPMTAVEWVEIQPFHQLGAFKWEAMGLDYKEAKHPRSTTQLEKRVIEQFRAAGCCCQMTSSRSRLRRTGLQGRDTESRKHTSLVQLHQEALTQIRQNSAKDAGGSSMRDNLRRRMPRNAATELERPSVRNMQLMGLVRHRGAARQM